MSVNENRFPAGLMIVSSQNNRITVGGKFLGIESRLFEALEEPVCARFNVGFKLAIGRDGRKPKKLDQIIKSIIPGHEGQNTGGGRLEPEVSKRNLSAVQARSWAADSGRDGFNTSIWSDQIIVSLEASEECKKL
jgi:hypothetical protein